MADTKTYAEAETPVTEAEPAFSARTRALNPVSHDVGLQIRILERLEQDPRVNAALVNVVVRNRSATLFGSAVDDAQCSLMQRLAAEVSGVIEVTNRLKVSPAP